ncbi:unnamed protein product, partial [marine sediment metagenome]
VTRKITRAVSRMALGIQDKVTLGHLDSQRDWGYAPEYVETMWRMLQQEKADDFVIATGIKHSVREFAEKAFEYIGVKIEWQGKGFSEKGIVKDILDSPYREHFQFKKGDMVVDIAEHLLRPTEVECLLGDYTKAKRILKWQPKTNFAELVKIMMEADLKRTQILLKGTKSYNEEWRQCII